MYMIKKIATLLCLITIICSSSIGEVYAENGYTNTYIEGTAKEISLELNKSVFTKADEAILISEKLATDALSATPLAYAKNAPIITTEWKALSDETINYLKELGVKKITIIGGLNLISRTTEKQLIDMGYEVERIKGSGPFQRSRKMANIMGKIVDVDKAIVVSSKASVTEALAVATYASQNNIPIILSDDRFMSETTSFINAKGYKEVYAIGNSERFINAIRGKINNDKIIIKEMVKKDTNVKIIEDTYKDKTIDSIYTVNVDYYNFGQMGEYNSLALVAAKQDIPVLICIDNYTYSQKKLIEEKNIKEVITVGKTVGPYKIQNALKNETLMATIALIVLLLLLAYRGIKS